MEGIVLANRSAVDRSKTDFYPTPPDVTTALLDFLEHRWILLPEHKIWEPACGTGEMAEVMKKRGYKVKCSDLYPSGYTGDCVDFLTANEPCDWIITNPPFSQAEEFIRHALEIGKPCAFLVKSQFWHAKRRLQLYRDHPPTYILPLTWRPDFLWGAKAGSPTMECVWTVYADRRTAASYIPLKRPMMHR